MGAVVRKQHHHVALFPEPVRQGLDNILGGFYFDLGFMLIIPGLYADDAHFDAIFFVNLVRHKIRGVGIASATVGMKIHI